MFYLGQRLWVLGLMDCNGSGITWDVMANLALAFIGLSIKFKFRRKKTV
jgi:hypothetical protein